MTKKYATRLKFTATIAAGQITSLTVAAAAYKGRSLQAAIDAGNANNDATAIKVGDTAIEFMVESQTTGDWEEAEYTITSGSVITKTKVLASSNAGAAVSFPAGTVDVYSTPSGSWLRRVLTIDDGVDIASLPTLNPSSLPSATPLGSYTIPVRDPASGLAYNLAVSAMMSAYAPAQTINVSTPNTQVAGAAFSVSGFYANGTPTALDWSIDGGTTWNVAASPTIASGAFTITGVTVPTANATQNVKVRDHATGVIGTSGSFVVSAAATAPGQVTGLTLGTATDTTQALSWAAPSTGTAPFTYKIEYSADNSNWAVFGSPVSGTSATVTGLTASKLYYYRVSAINSVNTGTASTVASGSTTAAPTVVPGQVTGLTAGTPTDTTQPLSWTAVATADSYIVEKSISGANSWSAVASGVTSTSYTVTGLVQSTAYDYRVTAKNTAGNGTPSATVTKSTVATTPTQTITVTTPATQTVGTAYTLSGTWTGVQPASLDYQYADNGGAATAWATLTGATINANGTWSASMTPTAASTSRVMSVRDHSTLVSGSSSAYVVNAAAVDYPRLTGLVSMAESGSGPYVYTGTDSSSAITASIGGISTKSLPAGVDGWLEFETVTTNEFMVGLKVGSTVSTWSSLSLGIWAKGNNAGVPTYYTRVASGTNSGNGNANGIAPAAGDILRVIRIGTLLKIQVARAATPTTFIDIESKDIGTTQQLWAQAICAGLSAVRLRAWSGFA